MLGFILEYPVTSCFHSCRIIHTSQASLDKPSVSFGKQKTSCSNQNVSQGLSGVCLIVVLAEMCLFVS